MLQAMRILYFIHSWHTFSASRSLSVQIEESDHLSGAVRLLASFQQQPAVVEGKAENLLHTCNDVSIADPAFIKAISAF